MKTDYSKWKYWDFNLAERQKGFDNKRPNIENHDGDLVQPIRIEPIPNGGSLSKKTITNYLS